MKRKIPIFLASDDRYLPYLAVTVKSVDERSSDEYIYDVRILTDGISDRSRDMLLGMGLRNTTVNIVNMRQTVNGMSESLRHRLRDYYSESIYYRMYIAAMYPELDKAIYIDCDTVLMSDIAELYDTDMGECILAAVSDESIPGAPEFERYVEKRIGVPVGEYINSGVLVMNLVAFREALVFERFIDSVAGDNPDTVAPDQDYLNILCHGRIHYLDCVWNKQPKIENPIPVSKLKLIHYNMFEKPWHYTGVLYEEEFWRVARNTPFYPIIRGELDSYTDSERAKDREGARRLLSHAEELAECGREMLPSAVRHGGKG